MTSVNPVTGDKLQSKVGDMQAYSDGYDRIFRKDHIKNLRTVEEHPPIEIHTIYKPIEEPVICVGKSNPCQLHDGCCEEEHCACTD